MFRKMRIRQQSRPNINLRQANHLRSTRKSLKQPKHQQQLIRPQKIPLSPRLILFHLLCKDNINKYMQILNNWKKSGTICIMEHVRKVSMRNMVKRSNKFEKGWKPSVIKFIKWSKKKEDIVLIWRIRSKGWQPVELGSILSIKRIKTLWEEGEDTQTINRIYLRINMHTHLQKFHSHRKFLLAINSHTPQTKIPIMATITPKKTLNILKTNNNVKGKNPKTECINPLQTTMILTTSTISPKTLFMTLTITTTWHITNKTNHSCLFKTISLSSIKENN